MRKVLAIMFMSLDGVAEFPISDEDPESGPEEDPMWTPRMGSIDTLILGRRAYEKWAEYWPARRNDPDSSAFQKAFSEFCDRVEKLVISDSLPKAGWGNSRVVRGADLGAEMARLKTLPGKDIVIGGGPRVLQAFLERQLVDELVLAVFPTLLGRGKPLFHVVDDPDHPDDFIPMGAEGRRDFRLVDSKPLQDGTVVLHYRRVPPKVPA
jgi:dihydrofolate reductase